MKRTGRSVAGLRAVRVNEARNCRRGGGRMGGLKKKDSSQTSLPRPSHAWEGLDRAVGRRGGGVGVQRKEEGEKTK